MKKFKANAKYLKLEPGLVLEPSLKPNTSFIQHVFNIYIMYMHQCEFPISESKLVLFRVNGSFPVLE